MRAFLSLENLAPSISSSNLSNSVSICSEISPVCSNLAGSTTSWSTTGTSLESSTSSISSVTSTSSDASEVISSSAAGSSSVASTSSSTASISSSLNCPLSLTSNPSFVHRRFISSKSIFPSWFRSKSFIASLTMNAGTLNPVAAVNAPAISLESNLPSLFMSPSMSIFSGVKFLDSICFFNWSRIMLPATSVACSPDSVVGKFVLTAYLPASIFSRIFSRPCSRSSSARSTALALLDLIMCAVPIAPAPPATPRAPSLRAFFAIFELCNASIFC